MFKIIPKTNGLYEANRSGDIRRVVSFVSNQPNGTSVRKVGGSILSPKTKSNGYMEVSLCLEPQKACSKYVHRLVAEVWLGDIPKGMVINHKDGNKSNNDAGNLEIVTYSENAIHAVRMGLTNHDNAPKGSEHVHAKTNEKEVINIREDHARHRSILQLQKDYNHLSKGCLAKIAYHQAWKHIK